MQVNTQNIKRSTLFQESFNKLITYSNDVIEYINTSTLKNVTSNQVITLDSISNTIKNIIKKSYLYIKNLLSRNHITST